MKHTGLTVKVLSVVVGMLGGYAVLTICLVVAAYRASGLDLAVLIALGATSIAVPGGGLLALLAASLPQRLPVPSGAGDGEGGAVPLP